MLFFPSPDHQRIYFLYQYLLTGVAMVRKKDGQPNYAAISDRLSHNREFRRIVSELFTLFDHQDDEGNEIEFPASLKSRLGRVTTGDVVQMLVNLRDRLETDYKEHKTSYLSLLHPEDSLAILHRLIELTPQERQQLAISSSDNFTLLQRTFLTLQQSRALQNNTVVFQLYQWAVGLNFSVMAPLQSLAEVDEQIQETVADMLAYLPHRAHRSDADIGSIGTQRLQSELTQKAQREIRRLLARSGNQHSPISGNLAIDSYIQHYFDPAFVTKLAQTVVANERLTDQLPVYLKRISIRSCGPLPFADKKLGSLRTGHDAYWALLHPAFQQLEQGILLHPMDELRAPGDYELASQDATQITAEFYVKVPPDYQPSVQRVFRNLASGRGDRLDFCLSSTGIGGALSHAVKTINHALLRDIPCLQTYFSIAHDVTSTQKIIRDNVPSPVWAHNLVKLCPKATMGQGMLEWNDERLPVYENFAFADPIGQGDYCGFDFFLSQAQAALHARLHAIRHAGVNPTQYLHELCHQTEQLIALQDAWSYLKGYPFSSFAMLGSIEQEILHPNVGDRPLTLNDSYIYFDAYLSIIEALLDEGGYRRARYYLNRINALDKVAQEGLAIADSSNAHPSSFEIFSGSVIVRYLICLANYYYLYDTDDTDPSYRPPGCANDINREGLVQRAWQTLNEAQKHIQIRLRKYVLINEVSQATFHPHYYLLSRIAFLQTKLLVFFSRFVPKQSMLITDRFTGTQRSEAATHWGRLYLAEKARLYAAADGDSELYACYAAIHCWLNLMAAYAGEENLSLPNVNTYNGNYSVSLGSKSCLDWAKTLRDHALISYAEAVQKYYYQIKEKSGLPIDSPPLTFGSHSIDRIPAIYEARGAAYERLCAQLSSSPTDDEFWVLDMSLLAIDPHQLPKLSPKHPIHPIYLFGTNACYLFFARGLYLLCSNHTDEFEPESSPSAAIDWDRKLTKAIRLLNLAWAIAEEGGQIERPSKGKNGTDTLQSDDLEYGNTGILPKLKITRSFQSGDRSNEYTSPEVNSVRDLYPRRISEIADLGKIFSAACMALRLQIVDPTQQEILSQDIEKILNSLHNATRLNRSLRALLSRQPRYNGHLNTHLEQARRLIMDTVNSVDSSQQAQIQISSDVMDMRNTLLQSLFNIFL